MVVTVKVSFDEGISGRVPICVHIMSSLDGEFVVNGLVLCKLHLAMKVCLELYIGFFMAPFLFFVS